MTKYDNPCVFKDHLNRSLELKITMISIKKRSLKINDKSDHQLIDHFSPYKRSFFFVLKIIFLRFKDHFLRFKDHFLSIKDQFPCDKMVDHFSA